MVLVVFQLLYPRTQLDELLLMLSFEPRLGLTSGDHLPNA